MGIAPDLTYTDSFDSKDTVRQNIIEMVNKASAVFERTFNIAIGLQDIIISDADCPSIVSKSAPWNLPYNDINNKLDVFASWRAGLKDDNAYWTLLTVHKGEAAIGLSLFGQLCSGGAANIVARTPHAEECEIFAYVIF
jgi:hypothetical protein